MAKVLRVAGSLVGKDGTSPAISTEAIENGTRISITDSKGTKTFDVLNGKDGRNGTDGLPGSNGQDGYTPRKGVDYFDGADGKDGQPGQNGVDGKDGQPGKDGADGITPHIGDNGNWWIGEEDTGVPAGSDSIQVDSELSETSENPVQNKVITEVVNEFGTTFEQTMQAIIPRLNPVVAANDNGKFLQVVNGAWAAVDATQQVVAIVNAVIEEALGGDY